MIFPLFLPPIKCAHGQTSSTLCVTITTYIPTLSVSSIIYVFSISILLKLCIVGTFHSKKRQHEKIKQILFLCYIFISSLSDIKHTAFAYFIISVSKVIYPKTTYFLCSVFSFVVFIFFVDVFVVFPSFFMLQHFWRRWVLIRCLGIFI
jgi:hypothetical protein